MNVNAAVSMQFLLMIQTGPLATQTKPTVFLAVSLN
jgi:hypothetical protein